MQDQTDDTRRGASQEDSNITLPDRVTQQEDEHGDQANHDQRGAEA